MAATSSGRMPWWTWVWPGLGWVLLAMTASAERSGVLAGIVGAILIAVVFAAVYHAEVVAHRVGEPYGTLVFALVVTVIDRDETFRLEALVDKKMCQPVRPPVQLLIGEPELVLDESDRARRGSRPVCEDARDGPVPGIEGLRSIDPLHQSRCLPVPRRVHYAEIG